MKRNTATFLLLCLAITNFTFAQQKDSSLVNQMLETLQKKYFSFSVIVRNVADFQPERTFTGNNGFSVENFRLKISGDLDNGFGYDLEGKLLNSPVITDTKLYYKLYPELRIDFGMFKVPFSGEYLLGEQYIDFVFRSQAVVQLNPGKQVGVQLSGAPKDSVFTYAAGIFNGNKLPNENDNNDFLYVGRVTFSPGISSNKSNIITLGINSAISKDKSVSILGSNFDGDRFLIGGDILFRCNKFLFNTEAIYSNLKNIYGVKTEPFGYQITAGFMMSANTQLLGRWDSFRSDTSIPFRNLGIFGFNIWPTKVTEVQINYIVPTNDGKLKHHQLLFNLQFYF
jgi:hypothetical protein